MEFRPPGVVVGRGTLDERARARVVLQIVRVQIGPTWPTGDHKDRRRRERDGRDGDAQMDARVREAHDRPIRSPCGVRTYTIAPITITTKPNPAGVSGTVVKRDVATATKTTPDRGRSRPSAVRTKNSRSASAAQMTSVRGPATGNARK